MTQGVGAGEGSQWAKEVALSIFVPEEDKDAPIAVWYRDSANSATRPPAARTDRDNG
jgi:hypothetical protein